MLEEAAWRARSPGASRAAELADQSAGWHRPAGPKPFSHAGKASDVTNVSPPSKSPVRSRLLSRSRITGLTSPISFFRKQYLTRVLNRPTNIYKDIEIIFT